ncbi:MAG: ABC transporter permease subunit [Armatimonadetes bacterium]|nr:ABC transporter permease subunit [Armatimonadota bacterium]
MEQRVRVFSIRQFTLRPLAWGDAVVLLGVAVLVYVGVRLALATPAVIHGPAISLSPRALPLYAGLSLARMGVAYLLSLFFSLVYGYLAAYNRRAEKILLPLLDVLQSIPILSFLPVVMLSLRAILPQHVAAELASVALIFTSQAWNLTFAWYQALTTIPKELREASTIFRFNGWLRLKTLELPFGAISLTWNSMVSWAGGWFFLMAAEIFTVGQRDFRLPGLGAYLSEAARQANLHALALGIGTLILLIIAMDQLVWRPLLAWSDRFSLELVESENPSTSWFYETLRASRVVESLGRHLLSPLSEHLDRALLRRFPAAVATAPEKAGTSLAVYPAAVLGGMGLLYGAGLAGDMLLKVPLAEWGAIGVGLVATLLRVAAALAIALAWTTPIGVAIGTNRRLAIWLQPLVQIVASVPATALFPVFLLLVLHLPGGLNLAALLLMLMGTQWYLLFNIIAGASAIPQDLKYTAALLQLNRWQRWITLILPALFPYIITGAITAGGGAWNASIVAEYVTFGGRTRQTIGIGALIAQATATGDYPLLLAATLAMILTVVAINRLVWRRFYRLAEERFRME